MIEKPKSTFVRRVRAAKPRDKRYDNRDDVVTGLIFRVFPERDAHVHPGAHRARAPTLRQYRPRRNAHRPASPPRPTALSRSCVP